MYVCVCVSVTDDLLRSCLEFLPMIDGEFVILQDNCERSLLFGDVCIRDQFNRSISLLRSASVQFLDATGIRRQLIIAVRRSFEHDNTVIIFRNQRW